MTTLARQGYVAALDVGTTKICCLIAKVDGSKNIARGEPLPLGAVRIVGIGHQLSQGLRQGTVVDMGAAEAAIRHAVDAAERMAGETIDRVIVNVSSGMPRSQALEADIALGGHAITERDIRRIVDHGRAEFDPTDRELIHAIPTAFSVDGNGGIRDPRGMHGDRLGVAMHFVTASVGPLRNLAICVERCHLELGGRVLSPYASALSTLVEDERDLGAVCIDMGGGTTSLAVFHGGQFVYSDVIRVGGHHITKDIAQGLSTSLAHAERLKTLYGSALPSSSDEREMIEVPHLGEDIDAPSAQVPRSLLTGIIRPRIEETFDLVRDSLRRSGIDRLTSRRVVLTGGASQLNGVRELAARILDKQVRPGRPIRLSGLSEGVSGPAFATAAGLIGHAVGGTEEPLLAAPNLRRGRAAGTLGRIGQWLKENF